MCPKNNLPIVDTINFN